MWKLQKLVQILGSEILLKVLCCKKYLLLSMIKIAFYKASLYAMNSVKQPVCLSNFLLLRVIPLGDFGVFSEFLYHKNCNYHLLTSSFVPSTKVYYLKILLPIVIIIRQLLLVFPNKIEETDSRRLRILYGTLRT